MDHKRLIAYDCEIYSPLLDDLKEAYCNIEGQMPDSRTSIIGTGMPFDNSLNDSHIYTSPPVGVTKPIFEDFDKAFPSGSNAKSKSTPCFRILDTDDKNRLEHIVSSGSIHMRIKTPEFQSIKDNKVSLEISNTEDFLVCVNLIEDICDGLGRLFEVQNMCNTLCMILTFSGNDVYVDGELFSPSSIGE